MSNTQDHPAPLTPADADLNGHDYMPLFGELLRTSNFNARVSDAGFRAAIHIWWAAWLQVPAASLPNDEAVLCRAADLGRDIRAWKKVREEAMSGFVLCSDGRLYHRFLAPHAIRAWEERKTAIRRGKASGIARRLRKGHTNQEQGTKPTQDAVDTFWSPPQDRVETETNKGKEERGKTRTTALQVSNSPASDEPTATAVPGNPQVNPDHVARIVTELERAKVQDPTPDSPIITRWIISYHATPHHVAQACIEATRAQDAPKPLNLGYIDSIVKRLAKVDQTIHNAAEARAERTQALIAEQQARPAPQPIPTAIREQLGRALKPKPSDDFETFGT